MFKFLFQRGKNGILAKPETQREAFERLVEELNGAIALFAEKPKVTIEPATGAISFELPEQFPDEALALPAPEASDASKS